MSLTAPMAANAHSLGTKALCDSGRGRCLGSLVRIDRSARRNRALAYTNQHTHTHTHTHTCTLYKKSMRILQNGVHHSEVHTGILHKRVA